MDLRNFKKYHLNAHITTAEKLRKRKKALDFLIYIMYNYYV